MSTENIIESVHKLVRLHEQLKTITQSKTTVVKEGKIEQLSTILAKEQLLIQQVEKEEKKRANYVEQWFLDRDLHEVVDRTMTNMLKHLSGELHAQLEKATATLLELITDIKQQEHINHGLIQQSLQFVHMSLHMLQPSIEQMNYGNNTEQLQQHGKRSMFDSKA